MVWHAFNAQSSEEAYLRTIGVRTTWTAAAEAYKHRVENIPYAQPVPRLVPSSTPSITPCPAMSTNNPF